MARLYVVTHLMVFYFLILPVGAQESQWSTTVTGHGTTLRLGETTPIIEAYCERGRLDTLILTYPVSNVEPGEKAAIEISDGSKSLKLEGEILDRDPDTKEIEVRATMKHAIFAMIASGKPLTVSAGGESYVLRGKGAAAAVRVFRQC